MRHHVRAPRAATWLAFALATLAAASPAIAGPFTRLQVLLPGETAAPGTPSGKSGTPRAQTAGFPFSATVRACDDQWNTVTSVTHSVSVLASDASATLPPASQLTAGVGTFTLTFNAAGTFTVFAHDQSDNTIPDGASAAVACYVLDSFTFSNINKNAPIVGVPLALTVTARDPSGRVVSGYSGPVTLKEITSFGDGRIVPSSIVLTNGTWSGNVTMYRADETNISNGSANVYAYDPNLPAKDGTSEPFTVHDGPFARLQVVVPGQQPLPGSLSGLSGSPATQASGQGFPVSVYATDAYWNPVPSGDNVRVAPSAGSAQNGLLSNGYRQFTVSLTAVGTQTIAVSDLTNGGIQGMTSAGIQVISSAVDHFVFDPIATPQTAGAPVTVTIRATDASGNTVPGYASDVILSGNTGPGSISPSLVTFANGTWTGPVTLFGAGGAVRLTCSDFSSPPHIGTSASFVVNPGPFAKLQIILPGETAKGGTTDGKDGTPTNQTAGAPFSLTVRAVDQYWNLVSGPNDRIAFSSTDAFASIPAETTLVNGQIVFTARLYKSGAQTITVSDVTNPAIQSNTSGGVTVIGGAFNRVLVLAPGESPAPGTESGRTGTATDQSINYAFNVTVLATDQWWNPVTGTTTTDMVHLTSNDPLAQIPADQAMVNGSAQMAVRLATGGYQQITVSDITNPARQGSTTQVRAISSGFHLEASATPSTVRADDPFSLTVRITNDAGSVIQEFNSSVTIEVQNASTRGPGRGALEPAGFQILQGQRTMSMTYRFAESIILVVRDDAGNAPAISNPITITPGAPAAVRFASDPPWVGGNKHATLTARVVDAYENGIPDQALAFELLAGTGTLTPIDSQSGADGTARADFLSPRQPEMGRIRATAGALFTDLDLETAFVDPTKGGGYVTNYPNPFHPPDEPTTIAYKLSDHASVTIRIYTQTGSLVRREVFQRGAQGGQAGLNEFLWDGRNGEGKVVSSGGYLALIEAQGTGETMHVIRRKLAVVR